MHTSRFEAVVWDECRSKSVSDKWSLVGAFVGYHARRGLVQALKVRDLPIALLEDATAIGGAILVVTRF